MKWVKERGVSFSSGTRSRRPRSTKGACSNNTVKMTLRSRGRRAECFGENYGNREPERFSRIDNYRIGMNKVLRKRLLQPDTLGLIPTGGHAFNKNYSKKAMMWLLHMEETDGVKIMHVPNGGVYKVPELPHFSVDVYCPETRTIYEFFGCYFHGHTCQPFRDVITTSGDSLAEWYERTMSSLVQITQSGYLVNLQWE